MTKIVLIGGTAGTGKTTLAREICNTLKLSHRIGTGFIREALKAFLDEEEYKPLFSYSFRPKSKDGLIKNFEKQSELVCRAVNRIIHRAYSEGTSIVIEGSHLIPKFVNKEFITDFFILRLSPDLINRRLKGNTHSKRKITNEDLENIINLQDYILSSLPIGDVTVIQNTRLTESLNIMCG